MKDDNAPSKPLVNVFKSIRPSLTNFGSVSVSAYGIRENSTIAIIGGSSGPLPQAPPPSRSTNDPPTQYRTSGTSQHKTEASTIHQIQSELDTVRTTLWPSVNTLLTHISPPSSQLMEQQKPTAHALNQEHKRLSELLLQSLLRLDAITADGGWEKARQERKGAVKEVQGLLDRLDEGWGRRV
jgi:BAG domain